MNNRYTPLHVHIFSLLDSISCVDRFVDRAKEVDSKALALTDHGTIAGAMDFISACKNKGIKPIVGLEAYISNKEATLKDETNRSLMHIILLAKNKEGWKDLVAINNLANLEEHFYYNPRVHYNDIKHILERGNLIGSSACIIGIVAAKLFENPKDAYREKSAADCAKHLKENWLEVGCEEALKWENTFGKGNFFLEIQNEGLPSQAVIMKCIREISEKTGIKIVATGDAHFPSSDYAVEHEVLICSQTKSTLKKRNSAREKGEDILFGDNTGYYIKSYEEMLESGFTKEEIENTNLVVDMVEEYSIDVKKPFLPVFPLPDGESSKEDFFIKLCKDGLKKIGKHKDKEYKDRANMEFNIFKSVKTNNANLIDYFLIVWDIVKEMERLGSTTPVGRGSAAGCLCSYLLGVTKIDPIKYNLSFERFFNIGRMSEDRISLPDIDLDCSSLIRQDLVEYLRDKYGKENVVQISTYGTLAPKAAIKEVLRAHNIPAQEANAFTKNFPDKELKYDDDSSYTIEDALKISPEFAEMAEKYKGAISSAIKLQNCRKNRGVHAAGILIADRPIGEIVPLVWDTKSGARICAFEMGDAEKAGLVKYDLLGLKLLSVIDLCTQKINELDKKPISFKYQDEEVSKESHYEAVLNYFEKEGFKHVKSGVWDEFEKEDVFVELLVINESIKEFVKNKVPNEVYQFEKETKDGRLLIIDEVNVFTAKASDICRLKMNKIVRFGLIKNNNLVKMMGVEK